MRISLLGLVALCFIGCTDSLPTTSQSTQQSSGSTTIPTTSGDFRGHYVVPVPPNLVDASSFGMPDVDWSVLNGVATLHYELPVGLIGGTLPITLSAPLPSGATSVQQSGANGSGGCTAQGTVVTCSESLANLGALPINMTVVQQTAVANNVPVADATAVANLFPSDPIGTITFDLSAPAGDGDGGGGGGGGGDGGGGGHGRH
jgi:hypothetical protein